MMRTPSALSPSERDGNDARYRWVKVGASTVLALAMLGAVYLIAVRGTALVFDLSILSKYVICF